MNVLKELSGSFFIWRYKMVVYLYKWKIKSDKEKQFQDSWCFVTKELRDNANSLGSRLHKGSDGLWYGYAQWPDIDARDKVNIIHKEMEKARTQMRDAIEESYPYVVLHPVHDYLVKPNS